MRVTGSGLSLRRHGGVRLAGGCAPVARIDGSVSAGATFTHPADGVIAWTITTLPVVNTANIYLRAVVSGDPANSWIFAVSSTGGFQLYEQVAGVATLRATAAGVIADGHRVVAVLDGTTIQGYSNGVLRFTYASAVSFATAINGHVHTDLNGAAVSDLKVWSLACRASEGV